jgi:monofunctional biosynthetic peptidoglycan transglycosylase
MRIRKIVLLSILSLLSALILAHVVYLVIIGVSVLRLRDENPGFTSIMRFRDPTHSPVYEPHLYLPLRQLPPDLISAVLYIEDYRFYRHWGISIRSIQFALKLNRRLGYLAYGGSTITQQAARTLFLTPRKTYFRKYLEFLAALTMELILTKNRILELYLNYAEWGKGVYGVAEAADHYFDKHPRDLNLEEKLALIAIMPSPLKYDPDNFRTSRILTLRYRALRRFARAVFRIIPVLKSEIREIE